MANNHYDGTGVLKVKRVTDVIRALFGPYNLSEEFPGRGECYIAKVSEGNDTSWSSVLENLIDMANNQKVELPADDASMEEVLYLLACHFGTDGDEDLKHIIETVDFSDGDADLKYLVDIARCFDDGHGLSALMWEGCWHCDKPRLFEFGGNGEYYGQDVSIYSVSTNALEFGQALDQALVENDQTKAADLLLGNISDILSGIKRSDIQESLRKQIGLRLLSEPGANIQEANGIIQSLVDWETTTGGWESPCWEEARSYLRKLAG